MDGEEVFECFMKGVEGTEVCASDTEKDTAF